MWRPLGKDLRGGLEDDFPAHKACWRELVWHVNNKLCSYLGLFKLVFMIATKCTLGRTKWVEFIKGQLTFCQIKRMREGEGEGRDKGPLRYFPQ